MRSSGIADEYDVEWIDMKQQITSLSYQAKGAKRYNWCE